MSNLKNISASDSDIRIVIGNTVTTLNGVRGLLVVISHKSSVWTRAIELIDLQIAELIALEINGETI